MKYVFNNDCVRITHTGVPLTICFNGEAEVDTETNQITNSNVKVKVEGDVDTQKLNNIEIVLEDNLFKGEFYPISEYGKLISSILFEEGISLDEPLLEVQENFYREMSIRAKNYKVVIPGEEKAGKFLIDFDVFIVWSKKNDEWSVSAIDVNNLDVKMEIASFRRPNFLSKKEAISIVKEALHSKYNKLHSNQKITPREIANTVTEAILRAV